MTINLKNLGLPPERCWKLWVGGKSFRDVGFTLYNEGLFNRRTGKPFTAMAVQQAAAHYMLYNLADAKKDFTYRQQSRGMLVTDEQWMEYVARRAKLFFQQRPDSLRKYVAQHGLQQYIP